MKAEIEIKHEIEILKRQIEQLDSDVIRNMCRLKIQILQWVIEEEAEE